MHKILATVLVLSLLTIGCAPSPERTASAVQRLSCSGLVTTVRGAVDDANVWDDPITNGTGLDAPTVNDGDKTIAVLGSYTTGARSLAIGFDPPTGSVSAATLTFFLSPTSVAKPVAGDTVQATPFLAAGAGQIDMSVAANEMLMTYANQSDDSGSAIGAYTIASGDTVFSIDVTSWAQSIAAGATSYGLHVELGDGMGGYSANHFQITTSENSGNRPVFEYCP